MSFFSFITRIGEKMNESLNVPNKSFSLMQTFKEYTLKTGLSFWKKFKIYYTLCILLFSNMCAYTIYE